MDCSFCFIYQGATYRAKAYFSFEERPCYVFVQLDDEELVRYFGGDITLKTDGEQLLSKADDHLPHLNELRSAIFNAVKCTPDYLAIQTAHLR